jgi:hypothetical protein
MQRRPVMNDEWRALTDRINFMTVVVFCCCCRRPCIVYFQQID